MSDTAAATEGGFPPIPLMANSYNFQDVLKAASHAESLKSEDGQETAFAAISVKQALRQDIIEGQTQPAVPEGTELAEVEDASGRTVTAPVAVIEKVEPEKKTPPVKGNTPPATSTQD